MSAANGTTDRLTPREQLISLLQLAYSGELAAGYAYRGHWHSVSDAEERRRIMQIEDEEWPEPPPKESIRKHYENI